MGIALTVGAGEATGTAVVSTGLGGAGEGLGSGVAGEVDASIVGFTVSTGLGASVVTDGDADGEGETVTRG